MFQSCQLLWSMNVVARCNQAELTKCQDAQLHLTEVLTDHCQVA